MPAAPVSPEFLTVLEQIGAEPFSTVDFIVEYGSLFPKELVNLEERYGKGGRGAGRYYTVRNYVAHQLGILARQGVIEQLDFRPAPDDHGADVIMYWSAAGLVDHGGDDSDQSQKAPAVDEEFREGSVRLRTHLRRERHWRLPSAKREAFIKEHGKLICERCQMDPEAIYGSPIGNSVIEVHHIDPLGESQSADTETNLADLQCLCANCHHIVHAELRAADRM